MANGRGLPEKSMFGGLALLINGNMAVSASSKGGLLLRIDPARTGTLMCEPGVQRFQMRGRGMDGGLRVDAGLLHADGDLRHWLPYGVSYGRSLTPKQTAR